MHGPPTMRHAFPLKLLENARNLMRPFWALFVIALATAALPQNATAQMQMSPIFGPKQFLRDTGKPQSFLETFQNCELAAQYKLVVLTIPSPITKN